MNQFIWFIIWVIIGFCVATVLFLWYIIKKEEHERRFKDGGENEKANERYFDK
jgi:hypothetical protein